MPVIIGSNQHFIGCGQTITSNQTLTTDYNWMTVGPTTINSGVTVTIQTGAVWVVV
jgi:hypothetical protein